jgi:hypothetical protein
MADIDRDRTRLRRRLLGKDPKVLTRRPPNGTWSIIEHFRHLLFAEQAHLGGYLPNGFEWSPMGEGGSAGRKLTVVGSRPSKDIDEVLAEWDRIHRPIRAALKSARGPAAVRSLWGNHRHLNTHITIIDRLLRKFET